MNIFKWIYKPSGQCPVQADGRFLGYYFYFRSRWELSTIDFYKNEQDWLDLYPSIEYIELKDDYRPYMAGYITKKKARLLIYKGCCKFALNLLKKCLKK